MVKIFPTKTQFGRVDVNFRVSQTLKVLACVVTRLRYTEKKVFLDYVRAKTVGNREFVNLHEGSTAYKMSRALGTRTTFDFGPNFANNQSAELGQAIRPPLAFSVSHCK